MMSCCSLGRWGKKVLQNSCEREWTLLQIYNEKNFKWSVVFGQPYRWTSTNCDCNISRNNQLAISPKSCSPTLLYTQQYFHIWEELGNMLCVQYLVWFKTGNKKSNCWLSGAVLEPQDRDIVLKQVNWTGSQIGSTLREVFQLWSSSLSNH